MVIYVITIVSRVNTGWSAVGEGLPSSTYSGSPRIWSGTTQYTQLSKLLPTCYMLKSTWDSLETNVKQDIQNKVVAVVDPTWLSAKTIYPVGAQRYYTRTFNPDSIIEGYKEESIIVCTEGEKRNPETCWDSSTIQGEVCRDNAWVPTGETCPTMPAHGAKRSPTTCWDDSVIYAEVFDAYLKKWVPTGAACPTMPAHGAKRNPTTCWDGSVIYAEMFDAALHQWVPSGIVCPTEPAHGTKRNLTACSDGTVIHAEIFDAALHRWVPSGETCLAKQECKEGDKKAGYVCVAGKWQPAPAVPVVEPTIPEPEVGEQCYIKFDVPLLDMLPGIPCQWWLLPILPGFKRSDKP